MAANRKTDPQFPRWYNEFRKHLDRAEKHAAQAAYYGVLLGQELLTHYRGKGVRTNLGLTRHHAAQCRALATAWERERGRQKLCLAAVGWLWPGLSVAQIADRGRDPEDTASDAEDLRVAAAAPAATPSERAVEADPPPVSLKVPAPPAPAAPWPMPVVAPPARTTVEPLVLCGGRAQLLYDVDVLEGMRTLADGSVAMVATSPPYWQFPGVDYGTAAAWGSEATMGEHLARLLALFDELHRVLEPGGAVWLDYGDRVGDDGSYMLLDAQVALALVGTGKWRLLNVCTWQKTNYRPKNLRGRRLQAVTERVYLLARTGDEVSLNAREGGHPPSARTVANRIRRGWAKEKAEQEPVWATDIFRAVVSSRSGRGHPVPFPPALVWKWIQSGCREGGTVLDPFSGSAATGIAALRLGRRYVGIDIQRKYLPLAQKNLEDAEAHSLLQAGGLQRKQAA